MKGAWILAAVLLAWALASTTMGVYYYTEYDKNLRLAQNLEQKLGEVSLSVNLAVDYGNGTRTWYNATIIPLGATVFNATEEVVTVEHDPQFGPSFVIAINGVRQDGSQSLYWIWWIWDETQNNWAPGPIANDEYTLSDGQNVIWYLEDTSTWPPQLP
jgi:hypothetical protein